MDEKQKAQTGKKYITVFQAIINNYRDAAFSDGIMSLLFNPFFFARKSLMQQIRELGKSLHGKVLDVGCGLKPYEKLIKCESYTGLEYAPEGKYAGKADFTYDGHSFPFQDQEFDSIITSQVLEHVFNPEEFLDEIARCLKDNGPLLLTVPFVWDEHEQPQDFGRYSSFGLRYILEKHGFQIIEQRKTCNNITLIVQLLNGYIFKTIKLKNPRLRMLLIHLFTMPLNLIGSFLSLCLPVNDDLYLDNIILARKQQGKSVL